MMNYSEAKTYVLERLNRELPSDLFYHHVNHTLDVCNAIEDLCASEKVNGEDLMLLRTAGLFHDIGFIEQYMNNEPIAVEIARRVLPEFHYSEVQINIICDLILATQIPHKPTTHIAEIMCDADLDYLGREDFYSISKNLMMEWMAYGIIKTEEEFNKKQVSFFLQHKYFTQTAKAQRELLKQKHLSEIQNLL
jgi:uncharacterized protein